MRSEKIQNPKVFDIINRQKLLLVYIPSIAAGVSQKIYLPADDELKNSLITNIREYFGTAAGGLSGLPTTWVDGVAIAASNLLQRFCITFVNASGKKVLDNYPLYTLLNTAFINNEQLINLRLEFVPEKSYLTYFDITNPYTPTYVPLMFTFIRK